MWGLFSKDPSKDFPYELQDRLGLVHLENKSVWQLYNGKHKTSGDEVSVFSCDTKDGANDMHLDIARSACKRLKTLKHPSFLNYIASVETDKCVMVATERVKTLGEALENFTDRGPKRDNYIAWGIFQVTRGISFLNNDAKLKHNNIHSASVFVNSCGDWKISGLEYVCPAQQVTPNNKVLPTLDKYQPPEIKDLSKQQFSTDWSSDIWGLGCLIWEVFNGTLRSMDQLGTLGDIPSPLINVYKECVAANPKKRPNPNELVTKLRRGKILPQLINAFEFGNAGSSILAPVFKIGKSLDSKVFPKIESGFLDSEPLIREKTVISMIHLAPKLNYSNLDEIVIMKHFTRLVRIAAMNAIAATQQYYTVQETAGRVLPVLCPATADPEKPVREQAFKVVRGFLGKMEKVSEDPSLKEEMEKEVGSTNPVATAAASWATWAVGTVTSKFYKSSISSSTAGSGSTTNSATTANNSSSSGAASSTTAVASNNNSTTSTPRTSSMILQPEKVVKESARTDSSDGWGDMDAWQDNDDVLTGGDGAAKDGGGDDGWDDDGDWGSLETGVNTSAGAQPSKSAPAAAANNSSSFNSGQEEILNVNVKHLTSLASEKEDARRRTEERKAERQKTIEAKRAAKKGPMKLGAKKAAFD